jgi:hypothetical protein
MPAPAIVAGWRARVRAAASSTARPTPSSSRRTTPRCIASARRRATFARASGGGDGDDEAIASSAKKKTPQPPPAPAGWFLLDPQLWQRIRADFPRPPWGPAGLLRVGGFSLAAAAAFAGADALLIAPLTAADPSSPRAAALAHLAREGALAALLPGAVFLALQPDLRAAAAAEREEAPPAAAAAFRLAAWWTGPEARSWLAQALVTAAVAFPLAEPVLSTATAHVIDALSGGGAGAAAPLSSSSSSSSSSLAAAVRAAADAGDWPSVGAHAAASAVLAPVWEEVFWRGFFLASLARVLPPGAAVGASAAGFAALHLGALSPPSLALLGACCDILYLRSGGNLAAPLLFHGLWNGVQVAAVALGIKEDFL